MKTFQCTKQVQALKIADINFALDGSISLTDGVEAVAVDFAFMSKNNPKIGGYFVQYLLDGYKSYSPAPAFEQGYVEVQVAAPVAQPVVQVAVQPVAPAPVAVQVAPVAPVAPVAAVPTQPAAPQPAAPLPQFLQPQAAPVAPQPVVPQPAPVPGVIPDAKPAA